MDLMDSTDFRPSINTVDRSLQCKSRRVPNSSIGNCNGDVVRDEAGAGDCVGGIEEVYAKGSDDDGDIIVD